DWNRYEALIGNWLTDPQNAKVLLDVIDALSVRTEWRSQSTYPAFRGDCLQFVQVNLIPKIAEIASDDAYVQEALSERLANAGLLPMFGFPTRVRLLYTSWPYEARPWPPENGTVDRDLDIAITQFAPGSETVKDKAVHTACGVVELFAA